MDLTKVFVSGGSTFVQHSPTTDTLYVCSNGILKIFDLTKPEQEPEVLDVITGVRSFEVGPDHAVIASKSGECHLYDLKSLKDTATLLRSPLGLMSSVFTHGGAMVLSGGLDGKLNLVDAQGSDHLLKSTVDVKEQIVALSYNDVGDLAAVSLANGDLRVYSYTAAEPTLVTTFKGMLIEGKTINDTVEDDDENDEFDDDLDLDLDNEASSSSSSPALPSLRPDWHPNGDLLAIPTRSRDIVVYDRANFSQPKFRFQPSPSKPVVDLKWSPNGKYLASAGQDGKLIIWDYKTKKSIQSCPIPVKPLSLSWSRHSDEVVVGTTAGNIGKYRLGGSKFVEDEADEADEAEEEEDIEDDLAEKATSSPSQGLFGDEDDFIIDDDGAGYVEDSGKRRAEVEPRPHKHRRVAETSSHTPSLTPLAPFSPGSTPWSSNRRYLTINPIGYAWSVKQDGYNTITITFFDRSVQKEYHFRDFSGFDVASMNGEAILLAKSGYKSRQEESRTTSTILFKSHDQSRNWQREIRLLPHEFITSVSLGPTSVFVCTSLGYVRRYSVFGRLERLEKMPPVVACINSNRYLLTVTYTSPYSLSFNLQDLEGKYYQRGEGLPVKEPIRGIFFSSDGDPCIVGEDNVVLVLTRWRDPLQACWIPILDANEGIGEVAAGGNVRAWPLGLFKDQFSFIAVRGSQYPSFPLALPSEMEVKVPIGESKEDKDGEKDDEEEAEVDKGNKPPSAEEELLRTIVQAELLNDAIANDDVEDETAEERLAALSIKYDGALLKLVGQSCNEGDVLDAFYLATKLRDDRALAAAAKMAERLGLAGLVRRINKVREGRMEVE
ncbi:DEKNAAC104194 [Brettanomyces naardenensis]|uniref:DEKNAAC104194 n=1 Tax=Brettanomyces naardenensis TaxID=13370 RepID=A0A448YQE5_BRENA|nr:DEKNAAC104194 [Brettanomyces naardenensis]